ncbi:PREDICTED: agamous-like MADS-box protein AGL80 [Tarenaya hassleriana]|uniref:agamous-like MADS-box protein AGL80 n=1 Tax=Tarenaya hassleriana TaxID=28532 RepID=UPI00053C6AC3|nr:PREDICTED: agamous-like MADS-box protein AGL80 [Tarenaya hassleriana]XP_010535250.1 PREDICTED: agamous-like MADS-box protein AGL80 [Tarenaya hassleriana]XP_010535253.1 PREDICTED: agamous-like MADS-box protein AGL80 [Tarenaya hassleriana]XP_010535258.1 PREDICTED: agamous-like MADS-box protein AGL80 [Tarenaya hassleriana]XP_019057738.1 PREDICTED: agamous-like MADS-box protein AGL80 [Tarenaya hassleriana]
MGRGKLNHELIRNGSIRRVTFKKRKVGLFKKLSELTILCGIPACAIIYSDYNDDEAEVWPNRREANAILDRLHRLPTAKQTKNMLDQGGFLQKMIGKMERELEREQKKNRCYELGLVVFHNDLIDADYSEELAVAARVLEQRIKAVTERVEAAMAVNSLCLMSA